MSFYTKTIFKTPEAVQMLGRSKTQLLRLVDVGVLTPGIHFFRGPFRNSPITWDVAKCQERFAELARIDELARRPAPKPKKGKEADG